MGDRYQTLDTALHNRKLTKFEWCKYTVYAMDKKPNTNWYGAKLTEKVFVFHPGEAIPKLEEKEILPDEVPDIDWFWFTKELWGDRHWSKKYLDEDLCREVYRKNFEEERAKKLTKKADIMRRALGADVIAIDEMPISHRHPEAYESWMKGLGEWSNRMPTEEEKENVKKKIPWLYKMFYQPDPDQSHLKKIITYKT